jgi:uncharacterized protein YdhG (YjbR/CyaY superfamily)
MAAIKPTSKDVDKFISTYPEEVQEVLNKVRATIHEAAPGAVETINYGIPTFTLNGNLVHFSGFKDHIGFYPTPSGIEKFKKELSKYEGAKGSVKFPLDQPMPYELITKIVKFRVQENLAKKKKK